VESVSVKVKATYLRMLAHSERVVPPSREVLAVVHVKKPTFAAFGQVE
jgi:hypothetical protein